MMGKICAPGGTLSASARRLKRLCCVFSESQREPAYWSRQSLNTPSPVETELDLLVMRERARRGIRNSGYDVSLPQQQTHPTKLNRHITLYCNTHCFKATLHCTECNNGQLISGIFALIWSTWDPGLYIEASIQSCSFTDQHLRLPSFRTNQLYSCEALKCCLECCYSSTHVSFSM